MSELACHSSELSLKFNKIAKVAELRISVPQPSRIAGGGKHNSIASFQRDP